MDRSCGANGHALATHTAFRVVDVSYVVGYGDRTERTFLLAFTATDAGVLASLACYGTFIFIHASNKEAARLRPLLAQLDDVLRTSFHASAARGALLFIHLGDARLRIDANRAEVTSIHTVAIA